MEAGDIGPITEAMYEPRAEGEPPPIIREWKEKLNSPGQFIFLWTGVVLSSGGCLGWGCLATRLGEADGAGLRDVSAGKVERLLSPLANEGRVNIMQALFDGPLTPSELSAATGFSGGGLYHHLDALRHAGYVSRNRGRYRLTQLGCQLLVSVCCVADQVIVEDEEKGLAVGQDWRERQGR